MFDAVTLTVHRSQFPEAVHRGLVESLRSRRIDPKFHYDGTKQTLQWLSLHEALSPARNDPACRLVYEECFGFLARDLQGGAAFHVIGLGCGSGWKEALLLQRINAIGGRCLYTPVDVTTPMVVVASLAATAAVPACECHPVVADLAAAQDLAEMLGPHAESGTRRLITSFGLLPNFEPDILGRQWQALVREGDWLALSANLAPGPDYHRGVQAVLPQYDNPATRDWLMGLLHDLGFEAGDGELRFSIETGGGPLHLRRIAADFELWRERTIAVGRDDFTFMTGETLRVFFSYRYTPSLVRETLSAHGLELAESWISSNGEEGVFLCRSTAPNASESDRTGTTRNPPA